MTKMFSPSRICVAGRWFGIFIGIGFTFQKQAALLISSSECCPHAHKNYIN